MSNNHEAENLKVSSAPIIDMSLLTQNSQSRAQAIKQIGKACQDYGVFSVVNHGISGSVIQDALDSNFKFFQVPIEEKHDLVSSDVRKAVRFAVVRDERGNGLLTRQFLKLYAHPLEEWIGSWPHTPSDYREKMGSYAVEVRRLSIQIFEAIMESLNLKAENWKEKMEGGVHMMASNYYNRQENSCGIPAAAGIAPHKDHTIITVLLQSSPGLDVMNTADCNWKSLLSPEGSLQVLVGDYMEVLSNGMYKSLMHRVISGNEESRLSVVGLHSFAMDEIVEPARELVDEKHPILYKGSSLRDFIKHVSSGESKPFIETLKLEYCNNVELCI